MIYEAKSIIVGRKKREDKTQEGKPCFVAIYKSINNPHTSGKVPDEIVDFEDMHKVIINNPVSLNYLLEGNDLVINDLQSIEVRDDGGHLVIDCRK